ncbi:hypothetical protein C9374_000979 [Naegleria lovaniensis]|uniref:Eukaryotic translation initiation factor 4E n=1 Tax=Naegleria lovaniensis TaxID=51637 RepID=A0AA88GYQ2_NAELO|nr:uncharacterized protein C9374_000979 [Naegleria lovaniensis]KAG2388129.1 hypothetical protein C9374_000979 [Naegleria lovaniensis]
MSSSADQSPMDESSTTPTNEEEYFDEQPPVEEKKPKSKPKPLKNKWRFWHEKVTTGDAWKSLEHLSELCEFGTIQEFWSCFNNLPDLSHLKVKESFHLMKNLNESTDVTTKVQHLKIAPAWEDPYNVNGGEWVFRISKDVSDVVWRELVLAVIGEQYHSVLQPGDEICGLSVSQRPTDNVFKIWNKIVGTEEDQKKIYTRTIEVLSEQIKNIADSIQTPYYKKHKE